MGLVLWRHPEICDLMIVKVTVKRWPGHFNPSLSDYYVLVLLH